MTHNRDVERPLGVETGLSGQGSCQDLLVELKSYS